MPELMFVLKSLAIALVVTLCLQMRVGSTTIENHANHWIRTSSIPMYAQDVASGASLVLRNTAKYTSDFVAKNFGHDGSTQRAGRLNFEFKRSPQYEKERAEAEQSY